MSRTTAREVAMMMHFSNLLGGRVLSTPDAVVAISDATHADLLRLGITDS